MFLLHETFKLCGDSDRRQHHRWTDDVLAKLKGLERDLMPLSIPHYKSHTECSRRNEMTLSNSLNMTGVRLAQTWSSDSYVTGISDTSIGTSVPQHAMKIHGGVELQLQILLTSALDKRKQSDSRLSSFTTGAAAPFSYHVADRMGCTGGLIAVWNTKFSATCVELRLLLTSR